MLRRLTGFAVAVSSATVAVALALTQPAASGPPRESKGPLVLSATPSQALSRLEVGQGAAGAALKVGGSEDLEAQSKAVGIFDQLRSLAPGAFVSGGVIRDEKGVATGEYFVNFTEAPSEAQIALLELQPFQTVVSWGFPAAESELVGLSRELVERLDVDPAISAMQVGPISDPTDPTRSGIQLSVSPTALGEDPSAAVERALEAVNASAAVAGFAPNSIPVVWNPGTTEELSATFDATIRGGHRINSCTSGFTANYGGAAGVLTAGHCSGSGGWLYDNGSGIIAAPTFDGEHAYRMDVQFHPRASSAHTVAKDFKVTSGGQHNAVTGVGNPGSGQALCKYGNVTHRDCGESNPLYVDEVNQCRTFEGQAVCHAWSMNRTVTTNGDSGGPWFVGGVAYGLTIGHGSDGSWLTGAGQLDGVGVWVRR